MTIAPVAPAGNEYLYGSAVANDEQGTPHDLIERAIEDARASVRAEQEARDALQRALDARMEKAAVLLELAEGAMSQNEMARRIGLNPSTFLSDTKEVRRRRRTQKQE